MEEAGLWCEWQVMGTCQWLDAPTLGVNDQWILSPNLGSSASFLQVWLWHFLSNRVSGTLVKIHVVSPKWPTGRILLGSGDRSRWHDLCPELGLSDSVQGVGIQGRTKWVSSEEASTRVGDVFLQQHRGERWLSSCPPPPFISLREPCLTHETTVYCSCSSWWLAIYIWAVEGLPHLVYYQASPHIFIFWGDVRTLTFSSLSKFLYNTASSVALPQMRGPCPP